MSANPLLRLLGGPRSANRLRRWINLWPPFLGVGIRIPRIASDMKSIDKKPGRGPVRAEFRLSDAQVEEVRQKLKTLEKCEPVFVVEVKDESGVVIAEVERLLHVRKRAEGREQLRSGGGTKPMVLRRSQG